MESSMEKILLVDDEPHFREQLERAFAKREFTVFAAGDHDEAMQQIRAHRPEMAVFDLRMPGKSGLDLLKSALEIQPNLKIVILTGYGSIATATDAIKLGAIYYLPKPADVDEILNAFGRETEAIPEIPSEDVQTPSLARAEWEHINRVLSDCRGNISVAAKRLNIHRRTLQRKLLKFPPYI